MENGHKIFVGNVPFQCSELEFNECFEKMTGFLKAEIVCKNDLSLSRGFGFLTFDNQENAKKLIGNDNIILKDRTLRFSEYIQQNNEEVNINNKEKYDVCLDNTNFKYDGFGKNICIKQKNLLIVKNIKSDTTREYLYNIFSQFGQVGRHFIVTDHETGNQKSCAIVEIINDSVYESLIKKREIELQDNNIFEISKWKTKQQSSYLNNTSNIKNTKIKNKLFYGN